MKKNINSMLTVTRDDVAFFAGPTSGAVHLK